MKIQSTVFAMAMAFGIVSVACTVADPTPSGAGGSTAKSGGSSGSGSGGTAGSGGSSASGGSASGGSSASGGASSGGSSGSGGSSSCSNVTADVTPCGGDVVGTWTVTPSCLKWSGELDMASYGIGCRTAPITATFQVTGTWTANANGTYSDKTSMTGNAQLTLGASCLNVSGTTTTCANLGSVIQSQGYDSMTCTNASAGGCSCTGTIKQTGGIGVVSADPQASGNYATAANVLTADGSAKYAYCVAGNTMTWTPQTTAPPTTGTIVLQKGGTGTGGSGSGGAGGRGGSGSGGVTTQGGQSGSGGASVPGTGGRTAQGGAGGTGPDAGRDVPPGTGGTTAGGTTGTGGGTTSTGGITGSGGSTGGPRGQGPCDIYKAASTPCVAAYSMVRALSSTYSGPLYQVRSGSSASNTGTGGTTKDIGMTADGYADVATQDTFCTGTTCTVSLLYDQSGNNNNLSVAKKGRSDGGTYAAMDDFESSATKGAVTAGGHKVYSLYMNAREGYRTGLNVKGKSVPLGNTSEGIYMLADGTHSGTACCWDFGNVSPDPMTYGVMNTLFLGTGYWGKGAGSGPWFLGDFEGGVWAGGSGASTVVNNSNPSMKVSFAYGILKTSPGKYALRMADLSTANDLTTAYDGNSPKTWNNEGGILLGIGGDNSNNSWGTFYEGAITSGLPSNDTDLAVMKNAKAVGYTK